MVSYMYLATSGFLYMAAWVPAWLRPTLLTVMPALPCYEMIRSGIFGPSVRVYYDISQLSLTLAGITLFGAGLVGHGEPLAHPKLESQK